MSIQHGVDEYLFTPAHGRATIASPSRGAVPLHTEASGTAPPDAFGPFRVLHQVGAGALGPVFRAYDSHRRRLVAVKVFQLDLPPERIHLLVAELEALIAAELAHPAIAAPLATGTDGVVVYLAHEYVPADSVHHGALHPRDVLISAGDARLTGHGVARAIEKACVTATLRRPYIAPERIEGGPWDRRADVFSLAALTHEMLSGRRLTAIGEEAAGALTEVPGGDLAILRAAFARALAPKPADRFETAQEFADALQKAFPVAGRQSAAEPRLPLDDAPVRSGLERRSPQEKAVDDALRFVPTDEIAAAAGGAAPERAADLKLRATPDPGPDTLGELDLRGEKANPEPVAVSAAARMAQAEEQPLLRPGSAALRPAVGVMGLFDRDEHDLPEGPPDRAADRRASWPVAAALLVGIALGFGGGYTFGGRHVAPASAPAAAASPATTPPGREWTEGAVNEAPRESSSIVASRPDNSSRGQVAQPDRDATVNTGNAGRLVVRSMPPGARVFVDGKEQGRTPATVLDLAKGTHRLRVERAGYAADDRRIAVTAARSTQSVTVELKRPVAIAPAAARTQAAARTAAPGSSTSGTFTGAALSVDSRPGGARVFIDGTLVGTTPVAVPQLGTGAHAIRLERDGYRRWSSSIRIVSGEANRVTASLER
jgi:hypothetical protein